MIIRGNKKGQLHVGEYALLIIFVAGGITAMSLFVQRALQGQFRDAREMMMDSVKPHLDTTVDAEGDVHYVFEYEPYYAKSQAEVAKGTYTTKKFLPGTGAIFKSVDERTNTKASSEQLPPKDAD